MNGLRATKGVGILIVVLIILSLGIIAGTVALNMRLLFDERATIETEEKLRKIAIAISSTNFSSTQENIRHYEQDVGTLPSTLNDLLSKPAGVGTCYLNTVTQSLSGWCGPYFNQTFTGEALFSDEWGKALILSTSNRHIRSSGPNRTDDSGGSDDLVQKF